MDFHKNRGMEKVFGFLLVFFVNLSGIASANDSGKKVFVWEGVFSIHLIEKNDTYFSYRFEEYPKKPGARTFVLEISPSNEKFLGRSTSINLIADVVEKALSRHINARVTKVYDGAEAIKALEMTPFDLIISDMRMPIMSGLSLYEWMQSNTPALCHHFFIMSGDLGGPEIAPQLTSLGIKVLKKPFTVDLLVTTCRNYLESFTSSPSAVLVG